MRGFVRIWIELISLVYWSYCNVPAQKQIDHQMNNLLSLTVSWWCGSFLKNHDIECSRLLMTITFHRNLKLYFVLELFSISVINIIQFDKYVWFCGKILRLYEIPKDYIIRSKYIKWLWNYEKKKPVQRTCYLAKIKPHARACMDGLIAFRDRLEKTWYNLHAMQTANNKIMSRKQIFVYSMKCMCSVFTFRMININ